MKKEKQNFKKKIATASLKSMINLKQDYELLLYKFLLIILESNTTNNTEIPTLPRPDFSQYLYFLFAPTLLYRDKYPRNTDIHWDYVLQMFGQVIAAIFYVYYVVVRFCVPTFANLNQNQITLPIFISVLFNSIMPGSLFLLLGNENLFRFLFY